MKCPASCSTSQPCVVARAYSSESTKSSNFPAEDQSKQDELEYSLSANTAEENDLIEHGLHPDLTKRLFLYDAHTCDRINPNCEPYNINNEFVEGQIFLMIRTPDIDGKNNNKVLLPPAGTKGASVSNYLRDKKRQFEFQFQVKLKKIPVGPLYLGCELDQPLKLNMVQKAITSTVLGIVSSMNPGLHHSFGNDNQKHKREIDLKEGRYEKAHLSFLLESSMDRIAITRPGEVLPKLGQEIFEDEVSVKRRKKIGAGSVEWNLDNVYTMSFWSAYVNYIKWKCINLPGVRPFPLDAVIGQQPINLTVYALKNPKDHAHHLRNNIETYSHLIIENRKP